MASSGIEISGHYHDSGIIRMDNGYNVDLFLLDQNLEVGKIPYGCKIKLILKYEEIDFLNGENGIVWATYNYTQADTIKNALFIQNIFSEVKESKLINSILYKIKIENKNDIGRAIDFIWRDDNGLRLKPDWHYKRFDENESYNKWING